MRHSSPGDCRPSACQWRLLAFADLGCAHSLGVVPLASLTASRLLDHHTDSLQNSHQNIVAELAKNLVAELTVTFVTISQFVVQDGGPLQ